jgi:hypothetical protein
VKFFLFYFLFFILHRSKDQAFSHQLITLIWLCSCILHSRVLINIESDISVHIFESDWSCDFAGQKYDFKQNCEKCNIWKCVSKNLKLKNVEKYPILNHEQRYASFYKLNCDFIKRLTAFLKIVFFKLHI